MSVPDLLGWIAAAVSALVILALLWPAPPDPEDDDEGLSV